MYSIDHSSGSISSLYFPAVHDEGQKCIFVSETGSLIRTWWNCLSDIESYIVAMPGLGNRVQTSVFSFCGSLLAAGSPDGHTVTLYDMITLTVVRRLSLPGTMSLGLYNYLAFSPHGKTLVLRFNTNEIHISEVPDGLNVRRVLRPDASANMTPGAVAFGS
jgi:WD40 repeat protein